MSEDVAVTGIDSLVALESTLECVAEVLSSGSAIGTGPPPIEDTIDWDKLGGEAREALRHARAKNTEKAYAQDWRQFVGWSGNARRVALPADPHDVASYLAHLGALGKSVSKIQRTAAAIAYAHRLAGAVYNARHPVVLEMMESLRRKLGVAPKNQKRPLVEELLIPVCAALGEKLIEVRDRALLLLSFLCGCRASNLVALKANDLTFLPEGLDVMLRRGKTDQIGEGFLVAVPMKPDPKLCATRAVRAWLEGAGIVEGPVFRALDRHGVVGNRLSVQDVRRIVRRRAEAVGITPPGSKEFGAHSLRSGFCTSAAEKGERADLIGQQTGQSHETVGRYIRHANRFKNNAANGLLGGRRGVEGS